MARPAEERPSDVRRFIRDGRSAARLAAVQALYQIDLDVATLLDALEEFDRRGSGGMIDADVLLVADRSLFFRVVKGVCERREAIDTLIGTALTPDWPVERLEILLRAILRAGVFELTEVREVPPKVAVSQYVDLAHAFLGDRETALVNAVLDRLARRVREEEMGDGGQAAGG